MEYIIGDLRGCMARGVTTVVRAAIIHIGRAIRSWPLPALRMMPIPRNHPGGSGIACFRRKHPQ
jgi:hypothetical protein